MDVKDSTTTAEKQEVSRAPAELSRAILDWYDGHRRDLPWRARPGEAADPYAVWLSEIMLQQTTVATVGPYFRRFLARWPRVEDLAAADLDDVLREWQGLGYYARARNLHKCAVVVAKEHGGRFPETEEGLRTLPGIGAYTAAAIAAIAFDRPAVVVDGNVERVMARLNAEDTPLPSAKPLLREYAARLTPGTRAGDYAQAVMDLGATVCTPRQPKCLLCPWNAACAARAEGIAETLPRRAARAKADPAGDGLLADARRRGGVRRAAAPPAGERPPRRHDGSALDALERRRTGEGPRSRAGFRRVAGAGRCGETHLHAFPSRIDGSGRDGPGCARRRRLVVAARSPARTGAADRHEKGSVARDSLRLSIRPELVEGRDGSAALAITGFDRLSPNGGWLGERAGR